MKNAFRDLVTKDPRRKLGVSLVLSGCTPGLKGKFSNEDKKKYGKVVDKILTNKKISDPDVELMWKYLDSCREPWQVTLLLSNHSALFGPKDLEAQITPQILASWLDLGEPQRDFAPDYWSGAKGEYLVIRISEAPGQLTLTHMRIQTPTRRDLPAPYRAFRPDSDTPEGEGFIYNNGALFYAFARVPGSGTSEMRFSILRKATLRKDRFDFVGRQLAPRNGADMRCQSVFYYQLIEPRTEEALVDTIGHRSIDEVRASPVDIKNLDAILELLA